MNKLSVFALVAFSLFLAVAFTVTAHHVPGGMDPYKRAMLSLGHEPRNISVEHMGVAYTGYVYLTIINVSGYPMEERPTGLFFSPRWPEERKRIYVVARSLSSSSLPVGSVLFRPMEDEVYDPASWEVASLGNPRPGGPWSWISTTSIVLYYRKPSRPSEVRYYTSIDYSAVGDYPPSGVPQTISVNITVPEIEVVEEYSYGSKINQRGKWNISCNIPQLSCFSPVTYTDLRSLEVIHADPGFESPTHSVLHTERVDLVSLIYQYDTRR